GSADIDRSVATAIGRLAILPGFGPFEIGKNPVVRPAGQALRRPAVVVTAMATDIAHGVDRIGSADDLAARRLDATPAEVGLWFRLVSPVKTAEAPDASDPERNADQWMPVPTAGFEQQHANGGIGAEPGSQHATGRTGPNDDVVKLV